MLIVQGDHAVAAPILERVVDVRTRVLGPTHPKTARALEDLAAALHQLERYDEAEAHLRRVLQIERQRGGGSHYRAVHAGHNLAMVLLRSGKPAAADATWREVLPDAERLLPEGHWLLAAMHKGLGESLVARGAYADAEPLLLQSLRDFEAAQGDMDRWIRKTTEALAEMYELWGNPERAAELRQRLKELQP